jgi:hypothetical protein
MDVRPDGGVRVRPLDVAAKIGMVDDPALFDVTALIKDGDDDAHHAYAVSRLTDGGISTRSGLLRA